MRTRRFEYDVVSRSENDAEISRDKEKLTLINMHDCLNPSDVFPSV